MVYPLWITVSLKKTKHTTTIYPGNCILYHWCQRNENLCSHRNHPTDVDRNFAHHISRSGEHLYCSTPSPETQAPLVSHTLLYAPQILYFYRLKVCTSLCPASLWHHSSNNMCSLHLLSHFGNSQFSQYSKPFHYHYICCCKDLWAVISEMTTVLFGGNTNPSQQA
jgi:hypothetical protein